MEHDSRVELEKIRLKMDKQIIAIGGGGFGRNHGNGKIEQYMLINQTQTALKYVLYQLQQEMMSHIKKVITQL